MAEKGIVTKSTGTWYQVRMASGEVWQCRAVGKFRLDNLKLTNPIAVGDVVTVEPDSESQTGIINQIATRENYVVRQSPRKKHELHLLASNIDQAVLVMTIVNPNLKIGFIDRFLLMTEPYQIPTAILFNKADIYSEEELEIFGALKHLYNRIGYEVLLVSAQQGTGIEALRALLQDKTTLISGQSGVGKSSLLNAVEPALSIKTQELSDYSGKGQHTTTFAEMHPLSFGGYLIDTPGIKSLSFNNLKPQDIAHNFREFFEASENCRFGGNCLHRNEPGCAVQAAIEQGQISELRYQNYLELLSEAEDQNYWERRKE